MPAPFTYEEAIDIAEDFSDLEDTGLYIEIEGDTVSCHIQKVAVVPYPAAEKEQFMAGYQPGGNATNALTGYDGSGYDVMIIAHRTDNNDTITIPIQEYTNTYGVRYNYP